MLLCNTGLYAQSCPEQCVCRFSTISCDGATSVVTTFPQIESQEWIRILDVVNTNITSLQDGDIILPTVPRLIEVSLYSNGIVTLNNSMFVNNTLIKTLRLQHNKLQFVPSIALEPLQNLVYLALSGNRIQVIESNAFIEKKYLQFISLDFNVIQEIDPNAFNKLDNLTYLHLSFNNISKFSFEGLQNSLQNVHTLSIKNNSLLDIRTADGSFLSCQWLHLESNLLSYLQNFSLVGFPNLVYLNLKSNVIIRMDASAFGSSEHPLQIFVLENNNLEDIPVLLFRNLPNLRSINFKNNKIKVVAREAFLNNKWLKRLDLSYNSIHSCHALSLKGLTRLNLLKLDYNNLTNIPVEMLEGSSSQGFFSFHGNDWICDCNLYDVQKQFQGSYRSIRGMTCFHPIDFQGVDVMDVPFANFCREESNIGIPLSTTHKTLLADDSETSQDEIGLIVLLILTGVIPLVGIMTYIYARKTRVSEIP
ncbi:Slit-like 2 protein [Holothuria leucospilota]|uniref:Slit-like 2 protein n=1 Tax=Holothuria leucospilota TaxID=206669 RepID=A0A9Q0YTJ2_HOLLE|nr:Slit-like 2 protein [Holothuria leucospilota]